MSQKCSGVKRFGIGIIYNISDKEKNTTIFNSKFRPRPEHDLCRRIPHFARPVVPVICIGFPIVSRGIRFGWFFETDQARVVVEISNWKCLYFLPCQKCYKWCLRQIFWPLSTSARLFVMKNLQKSSIFHAQNLKSNGFHWISLSELTWCSRNAYLRIQSVTEKKVRSEITSRRTIEG